MTRLAVIEGGGLPPPERAILDDAAAAYTAGQRDKRVCVGAVAAYVKRAMAEILPDGSIRALPGEQAGPGHYVGCVEIQIKNDREWLLLLGAMFVTAIPMEHVRWACWREDADRLHPPEESVV